MVCIMRGYDDAYILLTQLRKRLDQATLCKCRENLHRHLWNLKFASSLPPLIKFLDPKSVSSLFDSLFTSVLHNCPYAPELIYPSLDYVFGRLETAFPKVAGKSSPQKKRRGDNEKLEHSPLVISHTL